MLLLLLLLLAVALPPVLPLPGDRPDEVEAGGRPHPLDGLPGGHHPYVLHFCDRVQEQLEPLLVVRGGEPATHISFPPIVFIIGLLFRQLASVEVYF